MQAEKAILTPEEEKAWEHAFEYYLCEGYNDESADRLAWMDMLLEFPRLAKYGGCAA